VRVGGEWIWLRILSGGSAEIPLLLTESNVKENLVYIRCFKIMLFAGCSRIKFA
jgi:hypothetical protein